MDITMPKKTRKNMMSKEYTRYGVSDILIDSKIHVPKWVDIKGANGDVVACVEVYYICDEDENGEEIINE